MLSIKKIPLTRTYDCLQSWVGYNACEEAKYFRSDEQPAWPEIRAIAERAFKQNIISSCKSFTKAFVGVRLTEVQSSLPLLMLLYYSLKTRFDQYSLENPDDSAFIKDWELFCIDLAVVRQCDDNIEEFFKKFRAFLTRAQIKFEDAGLVDKNSELDKLLVEINKSISDPNIFELTAGYLTSHHDFRKSLNATDYLSIETVQSVFYLTAQFFFENVHWVQRKVKESIESYQDLIFLEIVLSFEGCLKGLETFDQLMAKVSCPPDNLKGMLCYLKVNEELFKAFDALSQNTDSPFARSMFTSMNMKANYDNFIEKYGADYEGFIEYSIQRANSDKIEVFDLTLSTLKKSIDWLDTVALCHALLDNYITWPLTQMKTLSKAVFNWRRTSKRAIEVSMRTLPNSLRVSKSIDVAFKAKSSHSAPSLHTLSIEDQLCFIEGSTKKSPKSRRAMRKPSKAGRSQSLSQVASSSNHPPIPEGPIASSSASFPCSLSVRQKLLQSTFQTICRNLSTSNTSGYYLKSSIRHLEENFSYLKVCYENVQLSHEKDQSAYYFLKIVFHAYTALESALRFKVIKKDIEETGLTDGDQHHLIRKRLKRLGIMKDPSAKIAKELYGASFWMNYTYEQVMKYQQIRLVRPNFKIPRLLQVFYQALEGKEEIKDYFQTIDNIYKRTLEFLELLFQDALLPISEEGEVEEKFISIKNTTGFDDLYSINAVLLAKSDEVHSFLENPMLLQAKNDFLWLDANLRKITAPSEAISYERFSYYVRECAALVNAGFENITRAALLASKQYAVRTHNIFELLELLSVEISREERSFMENSFGHAYQDTRYPFELKDVGSKLHSLILEAELLREIPELNDGFSFHGDYIKSKLNFIKLPNRAINAQLIFDELSVLINTQLQIIKTHILGLLHS